MTFLDYLFWTLFARRLAPAALYLEILNQWNEIVGSPSCDLQVASPGFMRGLSAALANLRSRSLALIGIENPTRDELVHLYQQWRRLQERGYELLLPTDADFPPRLLRIEAPPRGLFLWGSRRALTLPQLAVVGSRDPVDDSRRWVESELAAFLTAQVGLSIASGGARGVDQCAHRVCLSLERETLVFLPSGFDQIYPKDLGGWAGPVFDRGGAFLSEYDPSTRMQKSFFGERNRLISGISEAVLIVEARRRSGTLLTARAAAEQGRAVFVVPGHPYDSQFAGSLDLLGEGATMVRDAQELSAFFQAEVRFSYSNLELSPSPRAVQSL